jgi:hypothetical protein
MKFRATALLAFSLLISALGGCDKNKNKINEKLGTQGGAAVWQKIPQDAFFAMALHRPEKTGPQMKEALAKMGLFGEFYKNADLDELQRDLGIDPFQPETLTSIGLDLSKGIALALDGNISTARSWYSEYNATISVNNRPLFYVVAGISDSKKLNNWINNTLGKRPGTRIMSPAYGNIDPATGVPLTLLVGEISYQPGTEEVQVAFVSEGGYLYMFVLEAQLPTRPEMIDPIESFTSRLPDFFSRTKTSITENPNFQASLKKVNTKDDCFLFFDFNYFTEQFTFFTKRDVIFLETNNDDIKRYQADERRYLQERIQRDIGELNVMRQFAAAFPGMAMGGTLEKDKMSCSGYSLVGASYQEDIKAVMAPSSAPPAYGTVLPSGTGFVFRESLNLLALKKLVFRFASGRDLADMERDWSEFAQISQSIGLDMEKDILGALTGHLTLSAPDLASFGLMWFLFAPSATQPQVPPLTAVIQLTSAEAGDKIIKALQPLLDLAGVMTETYEGEEIYWFQADGVVFSWSRVNSMMLASLSLETTKEMIKNIKKPGAPLTDKLPTPLAKSLITDANATGCTADMGSLFTTIANQNPNSRDAAMLYQLGSSLGSSTMKISYEGNGIQCQGDLVFK